MGEEKDLLAGLVLELRRGTLGWFWSCEGAR